MELTPIIEKAIRTAAFYHRNQNRKYPGNFESMPYITHLFSVALILSNYTDDENTIAAGILHDSIEDTDYTVEKLENEFGEKIKDIVLGVTEQKFDANNLKISWKVRKEAYLKNLENAGHESLLICAADKIHNLTSLINDHETRSKDIWANFNASKEEKMRVYGEILQLLRNKLKNPIVQEYEKVYEEALKAFNIK